jgi:putative addiction module component (TIGR02574 family)
MAPKVENLLKQAMEMSEPDRALLAERLLSSLDPQIDPDWEQAWDAEIARRLEEIESGKVKLIPWETVRARIRKSLRAHR